MKVLLYIASIDLSSGGVGSYLQLLCKALSDRVDLHIVSHRPERSLNLYSSSVHILPDSYLGFRKQWLSLLKELAPDVVHVNNCWLPCSAFALRSSSKAGYPTILSTHGMLEPWILKRHFWTRKLPAILCYQRSAVRCSGVIHATSELERRDLLKLDWNRNIVVIPNCIDFSNISVNSHRGMSHRILFLSRIHPVKGIEFLIQAVASLKADLDGYEIVIAGDGDAEYVNKLKTLCLQLDVQYRIHFAGPVFDDQKWELYNNSNLFVLPTFSENFGIVVAESLACGTPVITTTGAPWGELKSHNCGWQVGIGAEPLADALRDFLSKTPDELRIMGDNGRKLVMEKYSIDVFRENMLNLYKKYAG